MPTSLPPFSLVPILVERPWGGRRLTEFGKVVGDAQAIGESWEVVDLPQDVAPHVAQPSSVIADGQFAGTTLGEVVRTHRRALLGAAAAAPDGGFPLLVKLLDARENLSIQVHPVEGYVAEHPGTRHKTESWYVVDAQPGSVLYLGVRAGVGTADLARGVETGDLPDLLHAVKARPGSFHHLPAGLVHALGEGVVVAEVQTPSDTTFRMYDWTSEYGRPERPLHLDEAMASLELAPEGAVTMDPVAGPGSRRLIANDAYGMIEHRLAPGDRVEVSRPSVLVVLEGSTSIGDLRVGVGATTVVPATSEAVELSSDAGALALEVTLPGSVA